MFEVRTASIFAKILSKSKLTLVVDEKLPTAMMDIKKGIMYLPKWDVDDETMKFLVGHECSHVHYTPFDKWSEVISKDNKMDAKKKFIVNVVEDGRVDKLMKNAYRGLISSYNHGIKVLIEEIDFFGQKSGKTPIEKMSFLNKLNVELKANHTGNMKMKIDFTDDERNDINKVLDCKTFDDVMRVSQYLYDKYDFNDAEKQTASSFSEVILSKELFEKLKEELKETLKDCADCDDIDDMFVIVDGEISEALGKGKKNNPFENSDLTFRIPSLKEDDFITIPKETKKDSLNYDEFTKENKKFIDFMVQEFELYKNARNKSTVRNLFTGNLNIKKLHAFKYTEDLFERRKIEQKQKNHGLIILLDSSSSMNEVFLNARKQILMTALFAKRLNIPFRIFAFSDGYYSYNVGIKSDKENWCLVDMGSSVDSPSKFREKFTNFSRSAGGTPLCSSLIGINTVLKNFRNQNQNLDVVDLIVITDGECNSGNFVYSNYTHDASFVKTEKNFRCLDSSAAFYKIFKDLYNVDTITIDITNRGVYGYDESYSFLKGHYTIPSSFLSKPNSDTRIFLKSFIKAIA